MALLPRPSSKAVSSVLDDRHDPTLPVILEYQSPSTAIVNLPVPRAARNIALTFSSMVLVLLALTGVIKVDRVVSAQGVVIPRQPNIVMQPLETSIVRSIDVFPGDTVHAGQVLARLDPTFATADMTQYVAQVSIYQALVSRLQAQIDDRPFDNHHSEDPNMILQQSIYDQSMAEYGSHLENYKQKQDSLTATIAKANADIASFADRVKYAKELEKMRTDLDRMGVGSKLNTLSAKDTRAQMEGSLADAVHTSAGAQRDLAALVAERNSYVQQWHADLGDKLTDAIGKLSDARDEMQKAQLRRQLVELKAERDATVLKIAKVSVGSVLQSGQEFITLVPSDAPLEIEANVAGNESGYIGVGDKVDIKFDTFPYQRYGMAHGMVRVISPDSFTSQDEQRSQTGAVPIPQANALSGASGDMWYRARLTLDDIGLHNTPPGFHLVPGMPVVADIRVGKQSVLHYMLGKVIPVVKEGMREP